MSTIVKETQDVASPYTRHLGIFNPHKYPISATVIGCGAIGSFVAVGLAKMGVRKQTLFDFDKVEIENLPVQLHTKAWMGKPKVEATKAAIIDSCPETPTVATFQKWDGQALKTDVVVSAVDSLHVRKAIWESVKYDSAVKILVDARIGGQFVKTYAVNPSDPKDIKLYDGTFPKGDMEGSELPCTQRGVLDVSMFSASILVNQIRRFVVSGEKEVYLAFNLSGPLRNIM